MSFNLIDNQKVKITIHWSFTLLFIGLGVGFYITNGPIMAYLVLLGLIAVFGSVLFHELVHMYFANKLHYPTHEIVLYPLGGMSKISDFPTNPKHELLIAISGPISNFFIAVLAFIVAISISTTNIAILGYQISYMVFIFAVINLGLGLFNLFIPALPMDGGRVLRSLLSFKMPYVEATKKSIGISKMLAIIMGFIGFFYDFWLLLIAFFIYIAGSSELEETLTKYYLDQSNVLVKDIVEKDIPIVESTTSVEDLLHMMLESESLSYLVQNETKKIVGFVSLNDLRRVDTVYRKTTRVSDVMTKKIITLEQDREVLDAFKIMQEKDVGKIIVIDNAQSQNMVGILTRGDIMKFIKIADVVYSR